MNNIQRIFDEAVEQSLGKGEVGIQIAVYKNGELVADSFGGFADVEQNVPVTSQTLFNAFSCCKALTNAAVHLQVARGFLNYERPVAHYWPEFAQNGKGNVTLRDVLSHRSGIPQMPDGVTPELMADYDWMVDQMARIAPMFPADTANAYHSYTQGWISGELVRRTDPERRHFHDYVYEEITGPLGMKQVFYGVPEEEDHRVAKLYSEEDSGLPENLRKTIPAKVDVTANIWNLDVMRRAPIPGAGAHFSARDEVRFWAMLAEGGTLDGVRIFSPEQVRSFTVPRRDTDSPDEMLGYPVAVSTMGFWLAGNSPVVGSSSHIIAQLGAGNSAAWADPDNRLAVAVCHNRHGEAYNEPLADAVRQAFDIT